MANRFLDQAMFACLECFEDEVLVITARDNIDNVYVVS
jgi:hypothetical protein